MMRWLAAILTTLSFNASALSFGTDWGDVWYNPAEPGWGLTTFQQNDTIFAALYTYNTATVPTWYVASNLTFQGTQGTSQFFSGPLYETRGSYFGGPFVPGNSSTRLVGVLTINFTTLGTATITYSIDSVGVTKTIQRFTFKTNSVAGSYIGASIGVYSGCATNGYLEEPSNWVINQSGSGALTMTEQNSLATCTYTGQYVQTGKYGQVTNATLSCTNGASGMFSMVELDATPGGFTARATATFGGSCTWSGRVGGVRRN